MSTQHVNNRDLPRRKIAASPFIDGHGKDQARAVSLAAKNPAGNPYHEFAPGQIYAKRNDKGLFYPCIKDTVSEDMGAAGTVLPVDDVYQYTLGDYINVEGEGYRKVTAISIDDGTITIDGADVTLSEGDELTLDGSRSFDAATTTEGASTNTINVADASQFEVGDVISVGADTGLGVTAVDTELNELTVDGGGITYDEGDLVVSSPDGKYRIGIDVVHLTDAYGASHQNIICTTRQHGEARERVLTGLISDAKAALQPMVTFNAGATI